MMHPPVVRPLSPEERELKVIDLLKGISFYLAVITFLLGAIVGLLFRAP